MKHKILHFSNNLKVQYYTLKVISHRCHFKGMLISVIVLFFFTHFLKNFKHFFYFYYGVCCLTYRSVCHVCAVSSEVGRRYWILWYWSLESHRVGAGTWTPWKSSSQPLSHLSSPSYSLHTVISNVPAVGSYACRLGPQ